MEVTEEKHDGVLRVASFVKVVSYDKKLYPNGIQYYEVKQKESKEEPEEN